MITKSKLKEVKALEGLTEDQITAIENLSENDEQISIDENRSKFWKRLDEDVQQVLGAEKQHGIKSHESFKSALLAIKKDHEKVSEWKTQITEKDKLIKTLQEQVKKGGGDDALKTQITKLEGERDTLKKEAADYKTKFTEKEAEVLQQKVDSEKALLGLELKGKYSSVLSDEKNKIKFNPNIPEDVVKRELTAVEARVAERGTAVMKDDGTGKKTLVFVNAEGVVLKNKAKGLDAYTAEDLFMEELTKANILEGKRTIKGADTKKKPIVGDDDAVVNIDITSAGTQVEATKLIHTGLLANGIAKEDPKFNKEAARIYTENEVSKLPEQ